MVRADSLSARPVRCYPSIDNAAKVTETSTLGASVSSQKGTEGELSQCVLRKVWTMTLVLALTSPKSIWLVTDRRLSTPNGVVNDHARKFMRLETYDGRALIGYAGLGATRGKTEPADWMARVLRGRNLSVDQSIGVLAAAMNDRLRPHIDMLPAGVLRGHQVIAPAFVNGKPELYEIQLYRQPGREYVLKHTRYQVEHPFAKQPGTPRVMIGGSGGPILGADWSWTRPLLRLIRAYDDGKVTQRTVATHLAKINQRVAQKVASVGPTSIVSWYSTDRGGGHDFFIEDQIQPGLLHRRIPLISRGTDMLAFIEAMFPEAEMLKAFAAVRGSGTKHPPEIRYDAEAGEARIAALKRTPDDSIK
jgi:hypothetical protein